MNTVRERFKVNKLFTTIPILAFSFIILFVLFALINEDFYSSFNLITMLKNASFVGILSASMTMVLVSGEVDLSIGGNIGLTSVIFAYLFTNGLNFWISIILSLMVGVAIGLINGALIAFLRMNSLITTLGTLALTQGLAYTITNGLGIVVMDERLLKLAYTEFGVIPLPLIILVFALLIIGFILTYTKIGRSIQAIGGNRTVAYLCGLNVSKVKFNILLINAVIASFVGLLMTSNAASGMPQIGKGIEMEVLAVVILGGASLAGGEGSILGTTFALLILSVIYNGLTVANAPVELVNMIKGLLLLLIVGIYEFRKNREST